MKPYFATLSEPYYRGPCDCPAEHEQSGLFAGGDWS